jgi:enoyl-CoA hydratase
VPDILVSEPRAGVRQITLNRPEALNAINHPMYEELHELFRGLKTDLSVRAVILTGAGRGFSAGHDLRNPQRPSAISEDYGLIQRNVLTMNGIGGLVSALKTLPQPVIAAVKGPVAGIGYSLALGADMIIAGASTKFVNAFHNAGTGCEGGLSWLLPRAVGAQKAAEILFTGRPVLAEEALRIGLVLKVVADEEIIASALDLAADIAVNPPIGIYVTKQALWNNMQGVSLEQAIAFENRGIHVSQATEDAREKMNAFREKRAPDFKNT